MKKLLVILIAVAALWFMPTLATRASRTWFGIPSGDVVQSFADAEFEGIPQHGR